MIKRKIKLEPDEFDALIKRSGFTLTTLAQKLPTSRGHLTNIKKKRKFVEDHIAIKLCQLLNVKDQDLFCLEEIPSQKQQNMNMKQSVDGIANAMTYIISTCEKLGERINNKNIQTIKSIRNISEQIDRIENVLEKNQSDIEHLSKKFDESLVANQVMISTIRTTNRLCEAMIERQTAIIKLLEKAESVGKVCIILTICAVIFVACPLFNRAFSEPLFWFLAPMTVIFMIWENERLLSKYGRNPEK